jgi:dihydrofolate reductase
MTPPRTSPVPAVASQGVPASTVAAQPSVSADFAQIWQAAHKIVYSTTLDDVSTSRTQVEKAFDPDAVRRLKASSERDISVGGPGLAAQAIRAGLVDECHLFLTPILVGGGTASFPDDVRVPLHLLAEHRFGNGVVHLHYRTKS